MLRLRRQNPGALTCFGGAKTAEGGTRQLGYRLHAHRKWGIASGRALPRANAVFERLGQLLVDEFQRKTFFEVSHHPGLDLAQHHQRF